MKESVLLVLIYSVSVAFCEAQNNCPPSPLVSATVSTTNVSCNGLNDGTATISVGSGVAPYTYEWSPSVSSTSAASGLAPGTYSVTVKHAGCNFTGPDLVVNGDFSAGNIGFSSGYTVCTTSNCLLTAGAFAGSGYYAVGNNTQFFHPSFWGCGHTTAAGTDTFLIVNGNSVPNVQVWCETLNVTPNTDYVFSTWLSTMNNAGTPPNPALLQFTINGVSIGPTFNGPPFPPQCTWLQFCQVWNSGNNTTANICITNQNTILNGNDFGLDDISFKSCVSDSTVLTFTITEPPPLTVTVTATNHSCDSVGSAFATATASGGTAPYTYLWTTSPISTTSTVSNLTSGTYICILTDANGCIQQQSVTVTSSGSNPTAGFTTSADTFYIPSSTVNLTNTSSGATSWLWNFGDGSSSNEQNPIHTYPDTGWYCITLIAYNGTGKCSDTTIHCVHVLGDFSFYIPNTFTPNADGLNEFFFGKGRGIAEYRIYLFDRWGNLIWDCYRDGYDHSWDVKPAEGLSSACKWDGTVTNRGMDMNGVSGNLVQEDVYVWKVELTDIFYRKHNFIGHVNVVR